MKVDAYNRFREMVLGVIPLMENPSGVTSYIELQIQVSSLNIVCDLAFDHE
jgi:hypothetical protein